MYMHGNSGAQSDRFAIKDSEFFEMTVKIPHNKSEINKIYRLNILINDLITLHAKKSSCLDSCIAYFTRIFYDDSQFFKQKMYKVQL